MAHRHHRRRHSLRVTGTQQQLIGAPGRLRSTRPSAARVPRRNRAAGARWPRWSVAALAVAVAVGAPSAPATTLRPPAPGFSLRDEQLMPPRWREEGAGGGAMKGSVKPRRPCGTPTPQPATADGTRNQVGGGRRGGRRRASGRPRSVRPLAAGSRRRPEQRELGGGAGGKNSVSRARRCDQAHSGPRRPRRAAPRAKSGVAQVMSKIIPERPSPSDPHHNPQHQQPGRFGLHGTGGKWTRRAQSLPIITIIGND